MTDSAEKSQAEDAKGYDMKEQQAFKVCGGCKTPEACMKAQKCAAKAQDEAKDETKAEAEPAKAEPVAEAAEKTADPVAQRLSAMETLIAGMAESVQKLAETVQTGLSAQTQKTDELAQRVADAESGQRQSRKGADVEDAVHGSVESAEEQKAKAEFANLQLAGILGIRRSGL